MPVDLRQFIDKSTNRESQSMTDFPLQTKENESLQRQEEIEMETGRLLHKWQAPEFEIYEKSSQWYTGAGIFLMILVIYAMLTDGPIMAITFILVGIVGYIQLQKDPQIVNFAITTDGIIADKDIYLFENIHSFWIFYDPNHKKTISLHTKAAMFPYIHIPLADEDPVYLREIILPFIPEIKQEPSIIDTFEKLLHI